MRSAPPPSERRSWAFRARGRLRARAFWRGVNCPFSSATIGGLFGSAVPIAPFSGAITDSL
eukprot:4516532-Lingulodinium_polyedra.AAC.1